MENVNGLSDLNSFGCTGRYAPLSPYPFPGASTPYSDPANSAVESKGNKFKGSESVNSTFHQRGSSVSFLPEEEQPSWLDDLLDDTEPFTYRGHRRSASDSYAYFGGGGEATNTLTSKFVNLVVDDSSSTRSSQTKPVPLAEKNNQELDESSSQSTEGSGDRASGAQAKPIGPKPEPKRAKQHNNAQRSRVRKLQYITHLERTVQVLKAEGTEVSAELEFMEQQNSILMMENRALRQRMESISQEQMIKQWEQGMLEREISRLQALFHLQQQQQLQMHHQQPPPNKGIPKHRRNRSKDLDHQFHNNKDICSNRDPVSGPIRA